MYMHMYIQCTCIHTCIRILYGLMTLVRLCVSPKKYPLLYLTHNHTNTTRQAHTHHTETHTETHSALGHTLHTPPTFYYRYTCDSLRRTRSPIKLVTHTDHKNTQNTLHKHTPSHCKVTCTCICIQSLLLLLVAAVSLHSIPSL